MGEETRTAQEWFSLYTKANDERKVLSRKLERRCEEIAILSKEAGDQGRLIHDLQQQLAEAQKNERRYLWLRNESINHTVPASSAMLQDGDGIKVYMELPAVSHKPRMLLHGESLDAAIDRAQKGGEG